MKYPSVLRHALCVTCGGDIMSGTKGSCACLCVVGIITEILTRSDIFVFGT